MASTSNTSTHPQLEELVPSSSTSVGSLMPAFDRYKPPTPKLPFKSNKMYHVFLSFRGKDVRKTLVDHLYQALSAAGLNVFIDSDKLKRGEIIEPSLETAIKSSAVRIPIFSEGYANSAWCLKEAAAMLSTTDLIIPLFYHVEPTHVRYPLGESSTYKQSFLKHYSHPDRYPENDVNGWRDALQRICDLSGWSTETTESFEARLVKMVVKDLIETLDRVPLVVAKHPVGMDSVKNALIQKLNLNSEEQVVKIGIWGIGGIGKTTVAKAVYNQIYADFDAASFVSDVGTTAAEATGVIKLQKILLRELCKYDGKVDSVDKVKSLFRDRLGGKRVLLVLDDVVAVVQLDALVGDWLAPGSRVIITSKDKHILNVAKSDYIHEMEGLGENEGLQLFSWHAFLAASPNPDYIDISNDMVKACKGHPLSLEVIGSTLYDKKDKRSCWTEALDNITLYPEIHNRLYIGYKSLSDDEKEIFVDIACFFVGEHKIFPIVFWKSFYNMVETAVDNLSMKALIKIDDGGVFYMHDHLRDMGRTIAKKEKEGTRLWEAAHLSKIDFFCLGLSEGNPQRVQMLYRHDLLRYLHLQNVPIEDMTEDHLPPSLIWLRLEDCTFATGKNRKIKKILTAIKKTLAATRKPRQSRFESDIWQLKIMQLKGCSNLDSLPISSLFSLPCIQLLQHLDLERCRGLDNLPDTICNLSQLQKLNLGWCDSLNKLPDTIGNLSQLQHLDLRWCDKLNNLPGTIGRLSQLQYLDLEMCFNLKNLPDTIGDLSQLKHLNLEMCFNLQNLPDTIGDLSKLQHLDLKMCFRLNNLPHTIGNLSRLQRLELEGCASLNNLPGTIGNLSRLQHFTKPPTAKRAIQSRERFDVFLSFRGRDVRKTLVGDLFQALSAAGACVFLDSEKLEKGQMIGLSILKAIENSAIRIPIFSEGYADSAWCLKEAAAMLSSPGLIIPLFYHVDPTHVRYPENVSSPYKQSFLKHYRHSDRYQKGEIDGWKDALEKICSCSGWSMDITEGSEARLIKTVVVNDLLKALDRVRVPLDVGMDDVKDTVVQKLNINSGEDVIRVVIWGIGRIGKTTVAKAVYDQVCADFEVASFIVNVRTTSADPRGLPDLQAQTLKDLTEYDRKVASVDQGISLFRDRLAGKRVLLVLDDVDSVLQLDALVGDWLAPGSRVIVTSTDKRILKVARDSSEGIPLKDKFFVIGKITTPHN